MPVKFENFKYSYSKNGKRIFVPSDLGKKIGAELKKKIEHSIQFESFYYHLRQGGHVAALHEHRRNTFFARLDVEKIFFTVLQEIKLHDHFKWKA